MVPNSNNDEHKTMPLISIGFYYHYKHDQQGEINNYAYEVVGFGMHTELHDDPMGELVLYRPLYEAFVYKKGKWFDVRPVKLFLEPAVQDGKQIQRFTKITDPVLVAKLVEIRDRLY